MNLNKILCFFGFHDEKLHIIHDFGFLYWQCKKCFKTSEYKEKDNE